MIYAINRKTKEHRIVSKDSMDCLAHVKFASEQETLVRTDYDGWIKHDGGECPLPDGQHAWLRFDYKYEGSTKEPETMNWGKCGYDITHYRPILTEPKPNQWRGPEDGLPPVGTVCEGRFKTERKYRQVRVLYYSEINEEVVAIATDETCCGWCSDFRPIRSAEEVAVEAFIDIGCNTRNANLAYQAIRDGKIPGVKLENDND